MASNDRARGTGRITIDLEIANYDDLAAVRRGDLDADKVRRQTIPAVVDTGAARFVLPRAVAEELGLAPGRKVKVRYADGRSAIRSTAQGAHLQILGREGTYTAVVEPKRDMALVGAIVLEDLDLLADCTHQRVVPRDPRGAVYEIE
jgi:predicted aspartyl protease